MKEYEATATKQAVKTTTRNPILNFHVDLAVLTQKYWKSMKLKYTKYIRCTELFSKG